MQFIVNYTIFFIELLDTFLSQSSKPLAVFVETIFLN